VRRTKIVCTIGPASASPITLGRLVEAGMDVARLNCSHSSHAELARSIVLVREDEARQGKPIAVLLDLQGPKIRFGRFEGGAAELVSGRLVTLTTRAVMGTSSLAPVGFAELPRLVSPGDQIWANDGEIELRVERVESESIDCRVLVGGRVSDHKGVNIPGALPSAGCLTEKDQEDLRFGIRHGVDFAAVSFVRSADDIRHVRELIDREGSALPIIAKLERSEAVANLGEILSVADGVMVARGDLGVEVPIEEVPVIQKAVITQASAANVPVIVATQMLESMVEHLRPTRAEVSDVATAVYDGTDAVMLSAETAVGAHPVETVELMARIAARAEEAQGPRPITRRRSGDFSTFPEAISTAACQAARSLQAKAIVAFTQSGSTARLLSHDRPELPILAFTPSVEVQRRLALSWGVTSFLIQKVQTTDEMIETIEEVLLETRYVSQHDVVIIVSGAPMWVKGTTNLLKLHRIGERRSA